MNEETKQKIKELLQSVLDRMGISASVDTTEYFDSTQFVVKSPEAGILIGMNGEHLRALNYITQRMSEKVLGAEARFIVDVNDYQRQRIDALRELAKMSAQRVRYFKKDVELDPMSAYDRRIVHSVLSEYPDINTQSTGEGMSRRVVIKPL